VVKDEHLIPHHEAQYHSFSPALAEHGFQAIQRVEQSNNGLVVGGLGLGEPALVHSCGIESSPMKPTNIDMEYITVIDAVVDPVVRFIDKGAQMLWI